MATNYYNAQIGVVDASGNVNVIYPITKASNVDVTSKVYGSGNATTVLQTALDNIVSALSGKLSSITAGTGISVSGSTVTNAGVRSISTGSSNGTISVNTNGTSANVSVKGLGEAAYMSTGTTGTTVALGNHTHSIYQSSFRIETVEVYCCTNSSSSAAVGGWYGNMSRQNRVLKTKTTAYSDDIIIPLAYSLQLNIQSTSGDSNKKSCNSHLIFLIQDVQNLVGNIYFSAIICHDGSSYNANTNNGKFYNESNIYASMKIIKTLSFDN